MTDAVFQAPKRRPRIYDTFEAPLPVSWSGETEDHVIYRAELTGSHVLVTQPAHMHALYQRGYFGKGVFSRSRPTHRVSQQRCSNVAGRCLPVLSSSEYTRRLDLARDDLLAQGLDEESVSQTLKILTEPVMLEMSGGGEQVIDESGQREGNPQYDPLAEEQEQNSDPSEPLVLLEWDEDSSHLECRINPFPMMEYLQLSYEEVFFLSYALGCLTLTSGGEALSLLQLWQTLVSLQPGFPCRYAAYHHFRSRGWVPKSGVKYGSDFILYRKGPPFYHASYSVVVEQVEETLCGAALRGLSWRSLAALSRTTANVSKELLLCYIITPSDATEETFSSPLVLNTLALQEVMVSRWVSSRERGEQDDI